MKTATNMRELRDELLEGIAAVKVDPRRAGQWDVIANLAGKVVQGLKVELEDCALRGVEPDIAFLDYGQKRIPNRAKQLNLNAPKA
jgi:hypothetical protein